MKPAQIHNDYLKLGYQLIFTDKIPKNTNSFGMILGLLYLEINAQHVCASVTKSGKRSLSAVLRQFNVGIKTTCPGLASTMENLLKIVT